MSIKRMLKKVLFFCTCIMACSGRQAIQAEENTVVQKNEVTIDKSIFPDRYFRQEIARQADQNEDGMLSREEMQNVTELTISYPHQTFDNKRNDCDSVFLLPGGEYSFDGARIDFTGIELFTNLEILSLHNLEPQNIPFAELVKLKAFYLASAPAIELDFSGAGNLKIMAVLYTQLKGIDLKENHKLEDLRVQSCGLSQIDLTGCKNLQKLDVSYNNIQDLDLSKNSKLVEVTADFNQLSKLDIRKNPKLAGLWLSNNKFTEIDRSIIKVSNQNSLTSLGVTYNKKCAVLDISYMKRLETLDARGVNIKKVSIGKELRTMYFSPDRKKGMSVLNAETFQAPKGAKLRRLMYYNGNIRKLDLRHLKNLRVLELDSENEVLTEADLSGNLKLEIPFMPWENMKKLTVSRKISSGDLKYYRKMMKKGNGKLIVV